MFYSVMVRRPDGTLPIVDERFDGDTRVLLAGTSFAGDNGWSALMLTLARPIDARVVPGADGLEPLVDRFAKAAAEPGRYRLLIWEIVERGLLTTAWRRPVLAER